MSEHVVVAYFGDATSLHEPLAFLHEAAGFLQEEEKLAVMQRYSWPEAYKLKELIMFVGMGDDSELQKINFLLSLKKTFPPPTGDKSIAPQQV